MRLPLRLSVVTAVSALALFSLSACDHAAEHAASTSASASASASDHGGAASGSAAGDAAEQGPQDRITAYFAASDKAAAGGWQDLSYLDEYLTPELADEVRAGQEENAKSGARIDGATVLTDFLTTDQSDTTMTMEFCQDSSQQKATKDGQPTPIENAAAAPRVARFQLVRESADAVWMISSKGYYPASVTCDAHFAS